MSRRRNKYYDRKLKLLASDLLVHFRNAIAKRE